VNNKLCLMWKTRQTLQRAVSIRALALPTERNELLSCESAADGDSFTNQH
jgi:hypothetical protein